MRYLLCLSMMGCAIKVAPGPAPAKEAMGSARLVVQEDAESPSVYFVAMVAGGSARDDLGGEGTAWMTAHAMAEAGAGERSADEVRDMLYRAGNGLQVVVDKEWTTFRLRCYRDQATACAELFGDVLTAPLFEEAELARIRDEASYALSDGMVADEENLAYQALDGWIFDGHRYGHPAAGRLGVLEGIDRADVQRFHREHYVRPSVVVGMGGALSSDSRQALESRLEGLGATMAPDFPLSTPLPIEGRSLLAVETETDVVGFRLGHPIEARRDHADWPALYLAMTAFGAHRQSFGTLFRSLRGARGLNYGTYAYAEPFRERRGAAMEENGVGRSQSFFHLWIRPTSWDNGPFALKLALDELETLVRDGLPSEQFEDVQAYLQGAIPLLARDPGRRLLYAVEAEATGMPDPLDGLAERVAALTRDEVTEALARHLDPSNLKIVAVGGRAEELVARLTGGEATPIVYTGLEPSEAQAERDASISVIQLELTSTHVVSAEDLFR